MKVPFVARALRRQGATVVAFTSKEALRYVTAEALAWSTVKPVVERLTAAAEHLSDGAPFDAYLVAPATYNSINKIAAGVADGVVTSAAASALGRMERGSTQVLVAPTMHGSLHNRILVESLQRLHALGVRVVPPRDAYGKHNLPDERELVAEVCRAVSRSPGSRGGASSSPGGTTPVPIDGVRRIVNRFRGRLGIAVAAELHLRGAERAPDPRRRRPPRPVVRAAPRGAHLRRLPGDGVRGAWGAGYEAGVFSAGVADYRPAEAAPGKIPSGQEQLTLTLVPTVKVIEEARNSRTRPLHGHLQVPGGARPRRADGHRALPARPLPLRGGQPRRGADGAAAARLDGDARRRAGAPRRQARHRRGDRRSPGEGAGRSARVGDVLTCPEPPRLPPRAPGPVPANPDLAAVADPGPHRPGLWQQRRTHHQPGVSLGIRPDANRIWALASLNCSYVWSLADPTAATSGPSPTRTAATSGLRAGATLAASGSAWGGTSGKPSAPADCAVMTSLPCICRAPSPGTPAGTGGS